MPFILVTGGTGFIGSHAIVELAGHGYDIICVDFNKHSGEVLHSLQSLIGGRRLIHYGIDLCDYERLYDIFYKHTDIIGVIHFAAYKAVGESVDLPLKYYDNNLVSLLNVLRCVDRFNIRYFVFSSSATVYGLPDCVPVREDAPLKPATNPYGATKQMGEQILKDFVQRRGNKTQVCLLRYFNPAGAHPSGIIGESYKLASPNLTPVMISVARGERPFIDVFGSNWPTPDGTCLRDYVHVCDIASAHVLALDFMQKNPTAAIEIFNLGAGAGVSVLTAISAFNRANGLNIQYKFVDRRAGDVAATYADNTKAVEKLGWKPKYTLEDIMRTAWNYAMPTKV